MDVEQIRIQAELLNMYSKERQRRPQKDAEASWTTSTSRRGDGWRQRGISTIQLAAAVGIGYCSL